MKVLLDTDVILDFILQCQPFYTQAKEIFVRLAKGDFEAYVCDITILNIFYIARKQFDSAPIRGEISKLLQLVNICSANHQILQSALISPISDFEDAVQNEVAVRENLDAIITRNVKDFTNSELKIYAPDDFIQII